MNFFSPIIFLHWKCVMRSHKLKIFHIWTIKLSLMAFFSLQVLIQGLICQGASSLWQPWELPAFQISVNADATRNVQVWEEKGKHHLFLLLLHGLPYSVSHLLLLPVKTRLLFDDSSQPILTYNEIPSLGKIVLTFLFRIIPNPIFFYQV